MSIFFILKEYFFHSLTSYRTKGFGIHSPFVFDLVTNVFREKEKGRYFKSIEKQRTLLLKNKTLIDVKDYGAGSVRLTENKKVVADIAKYSLKKAKHARLLHRLVKHLRCNNILELGTSLGITTCYLSSATEKGKVLTIEGCENILNIAKNIGTNLNIKNIEYISGTFENKLLPALNIMTSVDFVFFDGNHKYAATIDYFEKCLQYINNDTIFVFDDIYLSIEMMDAWSYVKKHNRVRVTIDLFYMGFVFFRKELSKQDFKVKL